MNTVAIVVKHLFAAIAFVAAAFIAYWALTIIMWLLSWIVVILGTLGVGYLAYEHVREHGLTKLGINVRGLTARFMPATKAA